MKLIVPSLLALSLAGAAGDKSFEVDANHTVIGFKASTVLFDVPGHFSSYTVKGTGNPDKPEGASIVVDIDAKSIDTDNETRNGHLQGEPFFDVAKFPKITFTSKNVKKDGNKVTVTGTLDMHGVKKDVTIPFDTVSAINGAGVMETVYKGTTTINRKDFGIGADSVAAKISLKDDVELNLLLAGFWNDAAPAAKTPAPAAKQPAKK